MDAENCAFFFSFRRSAWLQTTSKLGLTAQEVVSRDDRVAGLRASAGKAQPLFFSVLKGFLQAQPLAMSETLSSGCGVPAAVSGFSALVTKGPFKCDGACASAGCC